MMLWQQRQSDALSQKGLFFSLTGIGCMLCLLSLAARFYKLPHYAKSENCNGDAHANKQQPAISINDAHNKVHTNESTASYNYSKCCMSVCMHAAFSHASKHNEGIFMLNDN